MTIPAAEPRPQVSSQLQSASGGSANVFRAFFENAAEGMFLSTPSGRFMAVNAALARMLGYATAEDLVGGVRDIGAELYVDSARRQEYQRLLHEGGTVTGFEAQLQRTDGAIISVSFSTRAVKDEHGNVLWYEGTVEDLTERRKLEDAFHHVQKMEALGRLAGAVAHDFNNLLMVIGGYAALLLAEDHDDAERTEFASQIKDAGERAGALTMQLLGYSRKQMVNPEPVDLITVMQKIEAMLRRLIGENVTLTTESPETAGWVYADQGQIEQVLVNLVVNARDAMPNGGQIQIAVSNTDLTEEFAREHPEVVPGAFVRLTVRDTGTGIPPEALSRIFEPYFTTKGLGFGTGLGLATVYGLVKHNKGYIYVNTQAGRGTTFDVYLPRTKGESLPLEATRPAARPAPHSATVLLVDDDPGVRSLARRFLETAGYSVLAVRDGMQAIEMAGQYRGQIDVIVSNVGLPGIAGPEAVQRIRSARPDTPAVFLSGYAAETVTERAGGFSIRSYLHKPFTAEALLAAVEAAIGSAVE